MQADRTSIREEIEDKLNNLPYVAESIIVQQNDKLVGLVYPDFDEAFAQGLKHEDMEGVMEENRITLRCHAAGLLPDFKNEDLSRRVRKDSEEEYQAFLISRSKRIMKKLWITAALIVAAVGLSAREQECRHQPLSLEENSDTTDRQPANHVFQYRFSVYHESVEWRKHQLTARSGTSRYEWCGNYLPSATW